MLTRPRSSRPREEAPSSARGVSKLPRFSSNIDWLPSAKQLCTPRSTTSTAEIRQRTARVLAPKPPVEKYPEFLRRTASSLDEIGASTRQRAFLLPTQAPSCLTVPTYQLETHINHQTASSDSKHAKHDVRHEFTKVFSGNAGVFRSATASPAETRASSEKGPTRELQRKLVEQRRQNAARADEVASQAEFEAREQVPHLPPRSSRFVAALLNHSPDIRFLHTPPGEWILDCGWEDDAEHFLTTVLMALRQTVDHRRVTNVLLLDTDQHLEGEGGGFEDSASMPDRRSALVSVQALHASRFTFSDVVMPPWFWSSLAACFKPTQCTIELTFHRCDFTKVPRTWEAIRDELGKARVLLRKISFSHCKGLPLMNEPTGVTLDAALEPHLSSLRSLGLRGTYVGLGGAAAISRLLQVSSLEHLDVANVLLPEAAILELSRGIALSKSLKALAVDGTGLLHGVGSHLYHAVNACMTIMSVDANCVDRASTRFKKLLHAAAYSHQQGTKHDNTNLASMYTPAHTTHR